MLAIVPAAWDPGYKLRTVGTDETEPKRQVVQCGPFSTAELA